MVTESSVPIFSQALSGKTFAPSPPSEARTSAGWTAHFRRRLPPASPAVIRKRRRSTPAGALAVCSNTSGVLVSIFVTPDRLLPYQSIPSNETQTHRMTTGAGCVPGPDSRPNAPAKSPCGQPDLGVICCRFSQGLSKYGRVHPCSNLSRPWVSLTVGAASQPRLAVHEETWCFLSGDTQNNVTLRSLSRRPRASHSWHGDDCRRPVAARHPAHDNSGSAGW